MSIGTDRLNDYSGAYNDALVNEARDRAAAVAAGLPQMPIIKNRTRLRSLYLEAVKLELEKNNALVQQAHDAAKAAGRQVKESRERAKGIARIIAEVSDSANALATLTQALKA